MEQRFRVKPVDRTFFEMAFKIIGITEKAAPFILLDAKKIVEWVQNHSDIPASEILPDFTKKYPGKLERISNNDSELILRIHAYYKELKKNPHIFPWMLDQYLIAGYIYYISQSESKTARGWPYRLPFRVYQNTEELCKLRNSPPSTKKQLHPIDKTQDREQMKWLKKISEKIQILHYSARTEKAYREWTSRFFRFHAGKDPQHLNERDIESFISQLAQESHVAAKTQNQALHAILFFFKHVLGGIAAHAAHPEQTERKTQAKHEAQPLREAL